MILLRLLGGGLLTALPLLGVAQAPAPYPRYYGGLALYASDYLPLRASYLGLQLPAQATVGYQLRPRLAAQASVAYGSTASAYFGVNKYYTGSAAAASPYAYYETSSTYNQRTTQVDLLARYTLTRQPAHRVQVDVLGGFALLRRRFLSSATRTDIDSTRTTKLVTTDEADIVRHDLLAMVGLGGRYRLGRHLEATLDVTLHLRLTNNSGFGDFSNAAALGLRYRFGERR